MLGMTVSSARQGIAEEQGRDRSSGEPNANLQKAGQRGGRTGNIRKARQGAVVAPGITSALPNAQITTGPIAVYKDSGRRRRPMPNPNAETAMSISAYRDQAHDLNPAQQPTRYRRPQSIEAGLRQHRKTELGWCQSNLLHHDEWKNDGHGIERADGAAEDETSPHEAFVHQEHRVIPQDLTRIGLGGIRGGIRLDTPKAHHQHGDDAVDRP